MKNKTHHIGKIENITRLKNSINGNPRYSLKIAGITCQTRPDSSLAYMIHDGMVGKNAAAIIGAFYGNPTLTDLEIID